VKLQPLDWMTQVDYVRTFFINSISGINFPEGNFDERSKKPLLPEILNPNFV